MRPSPGNVKLREGSLSALLDILTTSFAILLVDILVVVSDAEAEVGIGLLQRIVMAEQWFAVADWGIIAPHSPW